jgi:uncharacterized protein YjbI with pentapeptide repeats
MRRPEEIIINNKTLEQILIDHKHWLYEDCDGWKNMKANLCDADLYNADLRGVNLSKADLSKADLYGANLRNADLRCANLKEADLRYANLYGANLRNADLRCANLKEADLRYAVGNLIEYRKGKILTQDILGYKKCKNGTIVTLKIPRGAIVFSINGYKCRTNKAKVINIDGADRAFSSYKHMSYYVGDEITIYDFNCEYNIECAEGIHFFMTREKAENYLS